MSTLRTHDSEQAKFMADVALSLDDDFWLRASVAGTRNFIERLARGYKRAIAEAEWRGSVVQRQQSVLRDVLERLESDYTGVAGQDLTGGLIVRVRSVLQETDQTP